MKFAIRELNEKHGHTVIIITHDMPIVALYAQRVVVMGLGKILADGPTAEVFSQPEVLAQTFIVPPQITQLAQRCQSLGFDPGTLTVDGMLQQFRRVVGSP